jgi:pimeloyl-ACP methyl ester carboxylesterase
LAGYGPVVAPDLPGAVFGHTASPHRFAVRAEPSARFLRALTSTLGLDHLVVHGWSFGGLVALLFADLQPARVERLVLVDPTLPGPMSMAERTAWQTLGRAALLVGPALAGGLVGVFGSALVDVKMRYTNQRGLFDVAGGDVSRCSPELTTLVTEQLDELRSQPHRLRDGVIAFASAVSAMYVDRRPALEAIDRLAVPTLLLWGDQDPLIEGTVIDYLTARRSDWDLHIFEAVGHLPPWEVPDAYTQAVGRWLAGHASPSEEAAVEGPEA